jgi:hypothetical protein
VYFNADMLSAAEIPSEVRQAWHAAGFRPSQPRGDSVSLGRRGNVNAFTATHLAPREIDVSDWRTLERSMSDWCQGYVRAVLKRNYGAQEEGPFVGYVALGLPRWAQGHGADQAIFAGRVFRPPHEERLTLGIWHDKPVEDMVQLAEDIDVRTVLKPMEEWPMPEMGLMGAANVAVDVMGGSVTVVSGDRRLDVGPGERSPEDQVPARANVITPLDVQVVGSFAMATIPRIGR